MSNKQYNLTQEDMENIAKLFRISRSNVGTRVSIKTADKGLTIEYFLDIPVKVPRKKFDDILFKQTPKLLSGIRDGLVRDIKLFFTKLEHELLPKTASKNSTARTTLIWAAKTLYGDKNIHSVLCHRVKPSIIDAFLEGIEGELIPDINHVIYTYNVTDKFKILKCQSNNTFGEWAIVRLK